MGRLAIKKLLPLGSRKFHFPKVNKIGSIIGHTTDYNRGGPAAHTRQKLTQVFPPPPPTLGNLLASINVSITKIPIRSCAMVSASQSVCGATFNITLNKK